MKNENFVDGKKNVLRYNYFVRKYHAVAMFITILLSTFLLHWSHLCEHIIYTDIAHHIENKDLKL